MTRKEQALENLFNAYKLIGYTDNTAQHRIHDYRNSRISDIEMETERVIKFHKKNEAERARDAYFDSAEGSAKKAAMLDEKKSLTHECKVLRDECLNALQEKLKELLPGIAPYRVKNYIAGQAYNSHLILSHPNSNMLDFDIYDDLSILTDKENYNKPVHKIMMSVASIGVFPINEEGPKSDYYKAAGYIYSNHAAMAALMEFAESYKKDEFFANSNRMDEIDAWIKNPLNAEELSRR